jgi:hypothetical protein
MAQPQTTASAQAQSAVDTSNIWSQILNNATDQQADAFPGGRAAIAQLAAHYAQLRVGGAAAVTYLTAKEQRAADAAKLTPLTELYEAGTVDDLPAPRDYKLKNFSGEPADGGKGSTNMVSHTLAWLITLNEVVIERDLSPVGALKLLLRHTEDGAKIHVTARLKRTQNGTYKDAVVILETEYAALIHPDRARSALPQVHREHGETMGKLGIRIRHLATMATRNEINDTVRERDLESLSVHTLMGTLPPKVKQPLQAVIDARALHGFEPFSFHELVRQAGEKETQLLTDHALYKQRTGRDGHRIFRAAAQDDDSASEDSNDDDDVEGILQVQYNNSRGRRDQDSRDQRRRQDRRPRSSPNNTQGFNGYAPTKSHDTGAKPKPFKVQQVSEDAVSTADAVYAAEPTYDEETGELHGVMMVTNVHPGRYNVQSGECIKCGVTGHRAFGPQAAKCLLRAHPLTEQPCSYCKKGGHRSQHCPRMNVRKN